MTLDLLIRDARIVDGTGAPARIGDIGVRDGRIALLGTVDARAARTIDASGLAVAPGLIDLHTHVEYGLPGHPRAASMVRQGVTLVVTGNCGFSPFPVAPDRLAELRALGVFGGELSWEWDAAGGFMEHLARAQLAPNVALLVGHAALRIAAMGWERRAPTSAELDRMRSLLEASLRDGVFGMSTGLIYAPGNFADTEELVALARVLAAHGAYYASHIRGEGDGLFASVDEALEIGRRSGAAVQISHVKATSARTRGCLPAVLARLAEARASGIDVLADQYPYVASATTMTAFIPPWALDGGTDALLRRLADPSQRSVIVAQLEAQPEELTRTGMRSYEPEAVRISRVAEGPATRYTDMSLVDVARDMAVRPAEAVVRLLELGQARVGVLVFSMDERDVRAGLADPSVAVGSDGSTLDPSQGGRPHPRSYGTFVRVLGHYVRDERVLGLETAVMKMTGLPARRLGLSDRGVIREGAAADLVVFDPWTVRDTATFDHPHALASGVTHVIVNGLLVVDDGEDTGVPAGRVLRHERVPGAVAA